MLIKLKFRILVLLVNFIIVLCETQTVKINVKKSNLISCDKFISYQLDDRSITYYDIPIDNHVFSNAMRLFSPAYIKIPITRQFFTHNNSKNLVASFDHGDDNTIDVDIEKWKIFYNWIKNIGFTPVFQLPYEPSTFKPKDVLQILGDAYRNNMTSCVWQLGIDFKGASAKKYAEDLKTVHLMLNSFPKCNWYLVSADISFGSNPQEINKFTQLVSNTVSAIGWREPTDISSDEVAYTSDESLKNIIHSEIPVWVSVDRSSYENENFAQMLAHVGRLGFSSFFKKFNPKDYYQPTMITIIERLYNTLIGSRMFKSAPKSNHLQEVQSYVYCSKQYPGSLILMAVNTDDKLHSIHPFVNSKNGPFEIHQYIVNSKDKKNFVNGIEANFTNMDAYIKSKRKSSNVMLHLPGKSVGFWELLYGDIKECFEQNDITSMRLEPLGSEIKPQSTSDRFLQEMIRSTVANEMTHKRTRRAIEKLQFPVWRNRRFILSPEQNKIGTSKKLKRNRRDLGLLKKLPKINLGDRLPLRNLLSKTKLEREPKVPIVTDNLDSAEQVFQPSDNPYLPKDDVHLQVGKGGNADYDYVEFNDDKKAGKKSGDVKADFDEAPDVSDNNAYAPNEFHENFGDQFKVQQVSPKSKNDRKPHELWEANLKTLNPNIFEPPQMPTVHKNDAKLNYVVRELEPTWQQDDVNMKRTSDVLKSYYINPVDNQQAFVNYDQKYPKLNPYQTDDIHYIRRDQREKSDLPYWRSKRDISSHNQILNAVENIVESLEKVDKNLIQVENGINQQLAGHQKINTSVKPKSSPKLNNIKTVAVPKKKPKFNILKPKTRREADDFPSLSSWESSEHYNTITNEIHPSDGVANSGMAESIPIIKHAHYQPLMPENKEYKVTSELILPARGSDVMPISRTTTTVSNAHFEPYHNKFKQNSEEVGIMHDGFFQPESNSDSYYDHVHSFFKVVTHSFGQLMEQSHKQISGWWHIFS